MGQMIPALRALPLPAATHLAAACLATLPLAACHPGKEQGQDSEGAVRLILPTGPAPLELPPRQPEGAEWSLRRDGSLDFALSGQPALLSVSCRHGSDGRAFIHLLRRTRAEPGAKALFALEGNRRVARVPMNVTRAGDPGEWQGQIDAHAEAAGALKGGMKIMATLPGGGMLELPASREPGVLLDACRASDKSTRASVSSAPEEPETD